MRAIPACLIGAALGLTIAGAPPAARPITAMANIRVSRDRYAAHLEPSLAVNPRQPHNLLGTAYMTPDAHDMNRGRLPATFVSFDGGASWHDNGPLPLPAGYVSGANLVVAFTPHSIGIIVGRVDDGPDHTDIVAWRTTDGGRHVLPPVVLATGSAPGRNLDHPGIAVAPPGSADAGTVYVAWSVTTSRRSDVAFTRSVDDGQRFAAPRLITGPAPQGDVAPVVTAGPHSQVAIVYGDAGAAGASTENAMSFQHIPIKVVQSMDGGNHFTHPREIAAAQIGALTARPLPWYGQATAATDPRDGTLYVAFPQERPEAIHPSVALLRSRDGGRTWVALSGVRDAAPTARMDQLQPQLAVSADGTIALSYVVLWHGRADLYLTLSHNHGADFGPPVRVTNRSWDPTLGLRVSTGQFWIGDYQGLAAGPGVMYPLWNDTRSGHLEIYTAALATD